MRLSITSLPGPVIPRWRSDAHLRPPRWPRSRLSLTCHPGAPSCTSTACRARWLGTRIAPIRGRAQGQGELRPDPAQGITRPHWLHPAGVDLSRWPHDDLAPPRQVGRTKRPDAIERPRVRFALPLPLTTPARGGDTQSLRRWAARRGQAGPCLSSDRQRHERSLSPRGCCPRGVFVLAFGGSREGGAGSSVEARATCCK